MSDLIEAFPSHRAGCTQVASAHIIPHNEKQAKRACCIVTISFKQLCRQNCDRAGQWQLAASNDIDKIDLSDFSSRFGVMYISIIRGALCRQPVSSNVAADQQ